ncbi:MAG TPA: hypothetical protein VFR58_07650 [Flavisolibacter sp.]|nr:hypothetical protein [Flavisolibacter sp.]
MPEVLIAAVLLGFITAMTLFFIRIEKQKNKRHMNQFLTRFSELGLVNGLAFSSQEILQQAAIGLDGIHRKLLILTGNSPSTASNQLISLEEIKSCSVKKQYGTIRPGVNASNLDQYLEKISLCFELRNGKAAAEVVFYHHTTGNLFQVGEMDEKARHWETILSKMLKSPSREAA